MMASSSQEQGKESNSSDCVWAPSSSQGSQESSQESEPDESALCSTDTGSIRMTRSSNVPQAYCPDCDTYFRHTVKDLDRHFNGHPNFLTCTYCKKAVYPYKLGETERNHHKCRYDLDEWSVPSSQTASNDMNSNIVNQEKN